jgi:hypothetical protein
MASPNDERRCPSELAEGFNTQRAAQTRSMFRSTGTIRRCQEICANRKSSSGIFARKGSAHRLTSARGYASRQFVLATEDLGSVQGPHGYHDGSLIWQRALRRQDEPCSASFPRMSFGSGFGVCGFGQLEGRRGVPRSKPPWTACISTRVYATMCASQMRDRQHAPILVVAIKLQRPF